MWRGSLLPLGCAAAPKPMITVPQAYRVNRSGSASRSSGSKLPRHRIRVAFTSAGTPANE
ncbi:hypothetical protein C1X89_12830 [Pseudomonas sp. GP01-A8]|nr:hypothetical protein C1X90_11935 [Pseudomonas sp. GP01-A9]PMU30485.1 hypothetical protein C1X88_09505 [Pseudomonas sp. GP01-A13]PMU40147.1 hypothetical protein C1X89_12830 [Pseudomonas sp. GP01-A8]PMU55196.1 hypothetical protein C1X85_11015 [Pseudomonas sp. GP01-A6]PMU68912.1 hypothetical protein C1X81_24370 [Pseudomonas sp. FW215-L2]PMU77090.1 hypothetical protein C1X84_10065 [Pseudomonas sp. GP01-A1]PMU82429.1 hypothetical protein C1X91_14390 [Pseudomonas sp. GP01-A5]PMV10946.1 hypothet